MDAYTNFSNILDSMKRVAKGAKVRVKKIAGNTIIEREDGKEEIILKYHGRIVMTLWKCGILISDGGYGYSVSLKKRLNEYLNVRVFTEKFETKFSAMGSVFPLRSNCFIITNRFSNDIDTMSYYLSRSPVEYIEKLVENNNNEACGPLMVACDSVLSCCNHDKYVG
jgi:hypothetical protein